MRTILYKRGDMVVQAAGCFALAAGSLWGTQYVGGMLMLVCIFLAVTLPFAGIALIVRALGDRVAIRYDTRSLRVTTLFGGATMPWFDVRTIHREVVTQSTAFGLIKQDVSYYLVVTAAEDGGVLREFKVNEKLLDLHSDALPALVDDMARAHAGSCIAAPAAPSLAEAAGRAAANAAPPPRGFGRKGVLG